MAPPPAPRGAVSSAPLPTFIVIGAQKSATRWLRTNLGAHPDIYTAPREISYFSSTDRYSNGLDWYRAQFADWDAEPIVGEVCPAYLMWRHRPAAVAQRILETLGTIPLVAILRNPVDRASSALLHHVQQGRLEPGTDLLDRVREVTPARDPLCLVSGGWYAASLAPYQERFGDRLLVLLHDDLADDALGVYRKALHHVGADDDFVPRALDQVRFSYRRQREAEAAAGVGELTEQERRELYELFRSDVEELQQMIGRDLSMWDPALGTASRTS